MTDHPERGGIEDAFRRERRGLGIREEFPPEVVEAARAAAARGCALDEPREDAESLPFVTVDPPGSRDLDQALHLARAGDGYRLDYAIADVACFVERGGVVEREAWQRGVTFYAPDRRVPLYPESVSQGAASLLAGEPRPAVLFTLALDAAGRPGSVRVRRARVRSRAQLTYEEALEHVEGGGRRYAGEPFAASLLLLREVGELRLALERERGGVSLPIRGQHVQQRSALRLGYAVAYEEPNRAEEWNAQLSLLAGAAAAERMLAAGVGLLRTAGPADEEEVRRLRLAARTLGFDWPDGRSYPDFVHSVDPRHPNADALVWQARRVMRGADYLAFAGEPPAHPHHAALAMPYAHCTAPLRRLADRYVLDLLVALEAGRAATEAERETLLALPAVMNEADARTSKLERRVVDVAEAWTLRAFLGESLPATVLDASDSWVEVQIADPPVRARAALVGGSPPALGAAVSVRVEGVRAEEGTVELRLSTTPPARG